MNEFAPTITKVAAYGGGVMLRDPRTGRFCGVQRAALRPPVRILVRERSRSLLRTAARRLGAVAVPAPDLFSHVETPFGTFADGSAVFA